MSTVMTRGLLNWKSSTQTSSLSWTLTFGGAVTMLYPPGAWAKSAVAVPRTTVKTTAAVRTARVAMIGFLSAGVRGRVLPTISVGRRAGQGKADSPQRHKGHKEGRTGITLL